MTRGQFITAMTLGAAVAVVVVSWALASAVLLSSKVHLALIAAFMGAADGLTQGWMAALCAGGGTAAAVTLVKAQQSLASWLVSRELAKLRAVYRDVEMALGTEKAIEFAKFKVGKIRESGGATDRVLSGIMQH